MHRQIEIFLLRALILLSLLQFGCVKVGPDYVRPEVQVSPAWLEAGDPRVSEAPAEYRQWWRAFNDPVLDKLIDTAYKQNLSLRVAGVRVLESRAQLGIAVGRIFPQSQQATGSLQWNQLSQSSTFGTVFAGAASIAGRSAGNVRYIQDQIGLTASWELDFWGKFRRAIESADAALSASLADYDNSLVSLTADVANDYIQIRTLEKRIDIARQNVQNQRESLRIAEARFTSGVTSKRDVEQALGLLKSTESAVPALQTQLEQAQHALCILLGLPPSDLKDYLGRPSEIPLAPPEIAIGIPADLLRRRPDVRSAEYQAMSQAALIGVAKAELFPAFSLSGNFGFLSTSFGSSSLADMFKWSSLNYVAGPSVAWNIFNYGQITNNVRLQDARFQELLINYQNTVLTAQQEVEDALSAFLRAQEQADFLALSTKSSEASLGYATSQYSRGAVDFTTVLTSHQSLLSTQDTLVSTLGNISRSLVSVYRALGGGWEIREGKDIIPPEVKEAMAQRTNWGELLKPASHLPSPSEEPRSLIRKPDW